MTGSDLFLVILALAVVVMAQTWKIARRIDNYSIVDLVWSYLFTGVVAVLAWSAAGWPPRKLLVLVMVALWSLRLGTYLFIRIKSHHPIEDSRYQQLRRDYGKNVGFRMFLFFQTQAVSVALLSLPFLFSMQNSVEVWSSLELLGLLIFTGGLIGESVSDHQLKKFRENPNNKGQVCDQGLWRYSRHPNYFFESVIWWGFAVFALGSDYGYFGLISPLAITGLLLFVTGVPLAETQSLKSRGELYRQYQNRTSKFIPWWPKV